MRLLDLFCGAGGAAMGYHQAGFTDIVGIDNQPQPNYPFVFIQADALNPPVDLSAFDLIHASPPCQHFTVYGRVVKDITDRYADHVAETRRLIASVPHVIENVPGAPIRKDIELCGSMFRLDAIRRHRWFEVDGWEPPLLVPPHNHLPPRRFLSHSGRPKHLRPRTSRVVEIGTWSIPIADQRGYMGIDWLINVRELSEAIPPAYTKFIGEQFMAQR